MEQLLPFNWTDIKSWSNIANLGKELKSITFANGKVFEIADGSPTIPTNAITVKNTQYSSLVLQTNSQSSTTSFMLNDYTRVGARPTVNTPFVIYVNTFNEQKNIQIKSSALYFYDKNSNTVASFDNMQNKYWDIVEGHKYLFENGKDPVDLGEYETTVPVVPKTIKSTEYTSLGVNHVVSGGQDLIELAFVGLRGSSLEAFNSMNPTSSPSTAPQITPLIIQFVDEKLFGAIDYKYIRLSSFNDVTFTKSYLKCDVQTSTIRNFVHLHAYQFESGKDPVDLGVY